MKITLTHPAIKNFTSQAWQRMLTSHGKARSDCHTLSAFSSRLDKCANEIESIQLDRPNPLYRPQATRSRKNLPLSGGDVAAKFKGDMFEIFSELVIRLSPIDDRIDVRDYKVITEGDTGVDGYGTTRDGHLIAVQIKYRMWDKILNEVESHLHNFRLTARGHGVDVAATNPGRMLLITTGQELNWKTIIKFGGAMRCISRDASYGCLRGAPSKTVDTLFSLKTIVDNNLLFWQTFKEQVGVNHD